MEKTGLFGLLLTAFICLHCSKAEDPGMDCWLPATSLACQVLATPLDCPVVPVTGVDDDITGKWKLVTALQPFTREGPLQLIIHAITLFIIFRWTAL